MTTTENGKIITQDTKKGYDVKIYFENGKSMQVPSFNIPKDANGKDAVVERENGAIIKVVIDGKPYEKSKSNNPKQKPRHENGHSGNNNGRGHSSNGNIPEATAPYNFIPLNNKVVSVYHSKDKVPPFDKFHKDLKTGYIDINIETKTPIYIRDTAESSSKDSKVNPDFFSPSNRYRIPGSSIRGLIRNIVEIISYGKFNFFDGNKKFHFRSFMDKSKKLKNAYVKRMIESTGGIVKYPNLKAGYLVKKGHNKYVAKPSFSKENNCWFYRVEQNEVNKIFKDIKSEQFFENIFFEPVKSDSHKHHDVTIKYAKVTQISDHRYDNRGLMEGYLVRSGSVSGHHKDKTPTGKHMDWIITKPENNAPEIPVDKNVIENYKNDINRSDNSINLLKKLDDAREVPCFYVTDNNDEKKIISIGHTGMFRLAYKHELGDFAKQEGYEEDAIDIPTAIFGNETNFAGRVFFEDAYLDDNSKDKIKSNPVTPKILSGPKPTSFQLYLRQDTSNIRIDESGNLDGLKDYNDADAEIRGYKMYWHKNIVNEEYVETNKSIEKHKTQYTFIKPIKSGAKFSGRIRFENLSEIELGALLFALKLKEDLCHKIGMGKPLGLGSIKITPKLTVFDIKKRYGELFDGWEAEPSREQLPAENYINAFDEYVRGKIGEEGRGKKSLWYVDRIKDLERMLDFKNKPLNSKTEYMIIKADENDKNKKVFKDRGVLQVPGEIMP